MRKNKIEWMTKIAMLSAAAMVLMLFEFPLPFIAPAFYELDFSEVPVLVGAFVLQEFVDDGIITMEQAAQRFGVAVTRLEELFAGLKE